MEVKKYTDSMYGGANTYVVKNGNNAIIIDAGVSIENIEKDLEGVNVLGVFITHAHFDHIYYLEAYMQKYSPDLFISDLGYQKLYDSSKNMSLWYKNELLEKGETGYEEVELVSRYQFIPLTDNEKFSLGGILVTAVFTPGHSNDSYTFIIDDTAFVGDLIFSEGVGRTDFYDGDSKALVQSIMKLKNFPALRTIHSGHGESTTIRK